MSFVSETDSLTALAAEPAFFDEVRVPYPVLVPYSKYQFVERPFGVTVPLSLAVVGEIEDAALVETDGAPLVVKVASAPFVVPPSEVATRRKW